MTSDLNGFYMVLPNFDALPPELDAWCHVMPALSREEDELWFWEVDTEPPRIPAVFSSAYDPFDSIDFPLSEKLWPIVSSGALKIIKLIDRQSEIKSYPAILIDSVHQGARDPRTTWEPYDAAAFTRETLSFPALRSDEFALVHVPILHGRFDLEHSEYSELWDGHPLGISSYVLKDPELPLPPLFRFAEQPGHLFVTAELRAAWKKGGIYGPTYSPPDRPHAVSEVDVHRPRLVNPKA